MHTHGPKAGRTLLEKHKGNQFVFLNLVGCIQYHYMWGIFQMQIGDVRIPSEVKTFLFSKLKALFSLWVPFRLWTFTEHYVNCLATFTLHVQNVHFRGRPVAQWFSTSVSAAGNECAAGSAVVQTTVAARNFQTGMRRLLRLPPLLQMVMVQPTKL
jgi:hypothetical protein